MSDIAHRVQCPTLILHSRDDARVPASQAGELAALIPDSRLVLLDSRNHLLTAHRTGLARVPVPHRRLPGRVTQSGPSVEVTPARGAGGRAARTRRIMAGVISGFRPVEQVLHPLGLVGHRGRGAGGPAHPAS